jgi:uncharacterized protein (TIGR03382 family)
MFHQARTSIVVFGFLVAGSVSTANATATESETVVQDRTTSVDLQINDKTVLCSSADYGAPFLKVLVPELAGMTLLDHQNTGAGAPCVAAGACQPGHMPADLIDPAHPTETVDVNVKEVRIDEADDQAKTCTTFLAERVNVTIRGVQFIHERGLALGTRPYSDCAAGSDQPADDPGSTAGTAPHTGGCAAGTGGTGSALLAVMLGLVTIRRRRAH